MTVIAFIPARKGSKRFPGKNKALFKGKELYKHAIEQALKCPFIDEVLISTDDPEVIDGSLEYPIKVYKRPDNISHDKATTWDAVLYHLCHRHPNTTIILLQPTSPLRTPDDIYRAWFMFERSNCPVISGDWEYPEHYIHINGAIYITRLEWGGFIPKGNDYYMPRIYLMNKDKSIDIDYKTDLEEINVRFNNSDEQFHEQDGVVSNAAPLYWKYLSGEEECEPDRTDGRTD